MPTSRYTGMPPETDADGYLVDGSTWTPEIAEALADSAGVRLSSAHWSVVTLCREDAARHGRAPGPGRIRTLTGLDTDRLNELFPGDPADTVARIAGLTRPTGQAKAEPEEAQR